MLGSFGKRFAAVLIFCFTFSFISWADTIYLKSGDTMDGTILEETDDYVRLDFYGASMTFYRSDIERIDKGEDQEEVYTRLDRREDLDYMYQTLSRYYNVVEKGLKQFRCEVTSSFFEAVKTVALSNMAEDDPARATVASLRFYVAYHQGQDVVFEIHPAGVLEEGKLGNEISQAVDYTQSVVLGFFNMADIFALFPRVGMMAIDHFVEKSPQGYRITGKTRADFRIFLDNAHCAVKIEVMYGDMPIKIFPQFVSTDDGWLMKGYELDIGDGQNRYNVLVEYQEIEGVYLPQKISVSDLTGKGTEDIELTFSGFQASIF